MKDVVINTALVPVEEFVDDELPPIARLENWFEHFVSGLVGNVYDHPNHVDGTYIRTSVVKWISVEARLAETNNRFYRLGKQA